MRLDERSEVNGMVDEMLDLPVLADEVLDRNRGVSLSTGFPEDSLSAEPPEAAGS